MSEIERGGTRVQSVSRAARLLMLVAGGSTDGTGTALAHSAGLALPTAHHILSTLVAEGLLFRDAAARYRLGSRVAVLSEALQREVGAPRYLAAGLTELVETTGETSYVAVWRQGDVRLVAAAPGHQAVQVAVPTTSSYQDGHARASGKLFLAHVTRDAKDEYLHTHPLRTLTPHTLVHRDELESQLGEIRTRGYSLEEEEFQLGVCCVSAPVIDQGVIVAGYTISVPTQRWKADKTRLIAATVAVARATQSQLAETPSHPRKEPHS